MRGKSKQNAGGFVQPVQISRVHIATQATLLLLACYGVLTVGFFAPVTIQWGFDQWGFDQWGFDATPRNTAPALIGFLLIPVICLFVGKMFEIGAYRTMGHERRFLGIVFVLVVILLLAGQIRIVVSATGG